MLRGTPITVFSNGFQFSEEDLATIGIHDRSKCWGLWVPDRTQWCGEANASDGENPEHFLISPFEPRSWSILFRVELNIKNDRAGTLAEALIPIEQEKLSILSIEGTPAGHHHAVVTVIGEALSFKGEFTRGGRFEELTNLRPERRTFRDNRTWEFVHKEYAPEMLRYSQRIVDSILHANEDHPFLREIFLDPKQRGHQRGVLYSYEDLPDNVKSLGKRQQTPAVKCSWLQNHAFFSLYGRHPDEAIELRYKKEGQSLKAAPDQAHVLDRVVSAIGPTFRAIASFNLFENFVRIVLSPSDQNDRTLRTIIPYNATYDAFAGSVGFQQKLYEGLQSEFRLRHVSMTTNTRNLNSEEGSLTLLITDEESRVRDKEQVQASIEKFVEKANVWLKGHNCTMHCGRIAVEPVSSNVMFLSTKFDWMRDNRPDLPEQVRTLANQQGFRLLMGDTQKEKEWADVVPTIRQYKSTTEKVTSLIKHSDAFLQVLPRDILDDRESGHLDWLMFEFGAAQVLDITCAVIVDTSGHDRDAWMGHLRVGRDFPLYEFKGTGADKILKKELSKAVEYLHQNMKIRPRKL